jgi:hypothetical protein
MVAFGHQNSRRIPWLLLASMEGKDLKLHTSSRRGPFRNLEKFAFYNLTPRLLPDILGLGSNVLVGSLSKEI